MFSLYSGPEVKLKGINMFCTQGEICGTMGFLVREKRNRKKSLAFCCAFWEGDRENHCSLLK
uniref:Uncharacterized protein n=1 Tax=Rhizophora mucronata TaxID=61149 RepID=A0A2P2QRK4_RHIMU